MSHPVQYPILAKHVVCFKCIPNVDTSFQISFIPASPLGGEDAGLAGNFTKSGVWGARDFIASNVHAHPSRA